MTTIEAGRPEPPRGNGPLQRLYFVSVLLLLALLLAASVREALGRQEPAAEAEEVASGAGWGGVEEAPFELRSLTCFTCHGMKRYEEGENYETFFHTDHIEMIEDMLGLPEVGRCHACHAFQNHQVVINRDICAECH